MLIITAHTLLEYPPVAMQTLTVLLISLGQYHERVFPFSISQIESIP